MRIDLNHLQQWIQPNSRVLDLGCGDGTLLESLTRTRTVEGYGLEIDPASIHQCISRGVNVIDQNLDRGLGNFADKSFDAVVMTQAIQTLNVPHLVLEEMLRVGKECIITFPNFGHYKARMHLAFKGRMPVSDLLPYQWYDTPNIHFCTFRDFEVLCRELDITVLHRLVVNERTAQWLGDLAPNLFGETAIYHLRKTQPLKTRSP